MEKYLPQKKRKIVKILNSYEERGFYHQDFMKKMDDRNLSVHLRIPSALLKEFVQKIGEKEFALSWKENFKNWLIGKSIFAGDLDLRNLEDC